MARFTNAVPLAEHLLATAEGVERVGRVPPSVGPSARKAPRAEGRQLGGGHRRRDVFTGKKRGAEVGKSKRGKGTKIMLLVEGTGLPIAAEIASARPHEVNLIEPLLERRIVGRRPRHLIYDQAADSDPLRRRLATRRIELICPHRKNRKCPPTQDGRRLRRYKRRWKVERTISWLQNFRRLVVRYERYHQLFRGMVHLACLFTVLQRF